MWTIGRASRRSLFCYPCKVILTASVCTPRGAWFSCVSPFFVTFLLTNVSGMAAMYEVNAKKWGKDPKCARRSQCLRKIQLLHF